MDQYHYLSSPDTYVPAGNVNNTHYRSSPAAADRNKEQWKISSHRNKSIHVASKNGNSFLPVVDAEPTHHKQEPGLSLDTNYRISITQQHTLTTSPGALSRSRSPFSKIERHRPRTPIIKNDTQLRAAPTRIKEEPINEALVTKVQEKSTNKNLTLEEEMIKLKTKKEADDEDYIFRSWWAGLAFFLTCCIPNWVLSFCGGKRTTLTQQAWREKITLCGIIVLFCAVLGFLTFGMKYALCPQERLTNSYSYVNATSGQDTLTWRSDILVYGRLYPFDIMQSFLLSNYNITLTKDFEGADLSPLFDADVSGACQTFEVPFNVTPTICRVSNPYTTEPTAAIQNACIPIKNILQYYTSDKFLEFSWKDLKLTLRKNGNTTYESTEPHLIVLSDTVVDLHQYLTMNKTIFGADVDSLFQQTAGLDATYIFSSRESTKKAWPCIIARYSTGVISSDTMGCIAYEIVTDVFLAIVIMLMVIRYSMALVFHWLVSPRLTLPGGRSRGILAWRSIAGGNEFPKQHRPSNSSSLDTLVASSASVNTTKEASKISKISIVENDPRHTILFVTCYSEGEDSIKSTLDSLVETTYSNKHKLLFIVVDGIITGSGNNKPTSEICRDLLILVDCENDEEEPSYDYEAIADGYKRINQAQVYIGHYRSVPALLVIKCGNKIERSIPGNYKPGNRGKRDSQLILMTFFQKAIFYDTFTPLEYEIFWKMRKVMSNTLTPDRFELVLMVDADTRVEPDSITHMVAAMNNDITLMGLCGETKVANKSESWVTAIQVFEYFISHHYAKAFESIFGGVTCLPGCFSMYRIKAPKSGGWVPILANPDIIQEFNVTTVNTLHAKNLLLLGEDRFLSTLMLRMFPRRQMIFVPQAKCKTAVPSSFKVLLSQRRRWINSTVHNLVELSLVSDLCGIACMSMQFIVVIDLLSSVVLPAAVLLLFYFFVNLGMTDSPQYQPLFILLATLGLPALLILLTAKKLSYIGWMTVYLLALPIWNFVLPIYSFWHFDDFTWGETRKVNGEDSKNRNSASREEEENKKFYMSRENGTDRSCDRKLWHIWEKERQGQPEKQKKNKRDLYYTVNTSPKLEGHRYVETNRSTLLPQNSKSFTLPAQTTIRDQHLCYPSQLRQPNSSKQIAMFVHPNFQPQHIHRTVILPNNVGILPNVIYHQNQIQNLNRNRHPSTAVTRYI